MRIARTYPNTGMNMGTKIEINDTLNLTADQGFPCDVLNLQKHCEKPVEASQLCGKIFDFKLKEDARIFHLDPVRVFLVQNIEGKWLFWGHALIQRQEIKKRNAGDYWKAGEWETTGSFFIKQIYAPDLQKTITMNESPPGKSYF